MEDGTKRLILRIEDFDLQNPYGPSSSNCREASGILRTFDNWSARLVRSRQIGSRLMKHSVRKIS